jgi:hypothetical protein
MGSSDAFELLESSLDLLANHHVGGATLSRQSHIHGDILLVFGGGLEANAVDESEVNDVDRNLRVVAILQCRQNLVLGNGRHSL